MPRQKNWSLQRWAYAKVVNIFGADLRSLATFRIVLALLALTDLTIRATDLLSQDTDAGVLPRADLVQEVIGPWSFSLNLLNGQPFFQALLFAVGMLAALGVLVGYRTRLMVFETTVLILLSDHGVAFGELDIAGLRPNLVRQMFEE